MRFKLVYNEKLGKLKFNVLFSEKDKEQTIKFPDYENDEYNHHIFYPLPEHYYDKIKFDLNQLVSKEDNDDYKQIEKQIALLFAKRKNLLKEKRKKYLPIIKQYINEFKDEHPEEFI